MRTTDTIKNALGYGLTLQTLLGFGSDEEIVKLQGSSCAAGNIAEVVFHHVLKDSSSPERLRQLVVTNLAIYLDTPLWSQIASTATENMSKLIIEAMLHAKETKKESDGVKMEGRVISQ